MKALLFAITLFLSPIASAKCTLVFGDSLSSTSDSWPQHMEQCMHVNAQPGRMLTQFDPPRDLYSNGQRAVYLLGSNDAFRKISAEVVTVYARTHMRFLLDRGLHPLIVIPPRFPLNPNHVNKVRNVLIDVATEMGIDYIDLQDIWDVNQTLDTVHPNVELSRVVAVFIGDALSQ